MSDKSSDRKCVLEKECDDWSERDFDECSDPVQIVRVCEEFDNILRYNKGNRKDKKCDYGSKENHSFDWDFVMNSNSKSKRVPRSRFQVLVPENLKKSITNSCAYKAKEGSNHPSFYMRGSNTVLNPISRPHNRTNRAALRKLSSELILRSLLQSDQ
ncbi:unnamed protein product [Moneuplotes crassus]|uniref:Uncharacterized protein n=1 Tax=Euplotes crassus TaxID=5936 RepID=A0AAD1Y689_EUPCR|nr:unnamed protein product [Moneuplotes crassus]